MKEMILIQAPSNLGLKELQPGIEPGVRFFPAAMEKEGFSKKAGIEEKTVVLPPAYSMLLDDESKVRNADKIILYSQQLADVITDSIQRQKAVVVNGGDCSVLIGAALSLKRRGNYALFFLDGHTDYITPEHSASKGAAGMDLAIVTGNGHTKLTSIEGLGPYIKEENVFCVANRDYDELYIKVMLQSQIHYCDLNALRKTGMTPLTSEFLSIIATKGLDGFWIHFDVDVLDNIIMPCVDSPQKDGLSYEELHEVLHPLIHSEYFCGIDITIFDPTLDKENIYAKELASELAKLFTPS